MSWIVNDAGMNLDKLWAWDKKKIPSKIRQETGNPAADDLRERLVELVGGNLTDLLAEMKKRKTGSSKTAAGEPQVPNPDYETDKKFKEILQRKHVLGATEQALEKVDEYGNPAMMKTLARRNYKKVFAAMPKLPPKRILLEIQRERSRPLILPNYEERIAAAARLERKLAKQRAARKAGGELGASNAKKETVVDGDGKGDRGMTIKDIFRMYLPDEMFEERPVLSDVDMNKERALMYLSRIGGVKKESKEDGEDGEGDGDGADEKPEEEEKKEEKEDDADGDDETERRQSMTEEQLAVLNDAPGTSDAEAKLYCATALCNWARNPSNAQRLAAEVTPFRAPLSHVKAPVPRHPSHRRNPMPPALLLTFVAHGQGAVRAIMRLSLEPIPGMYFFCAGAFRFMSDSLILATQMIDDGAISTINDIVKVCHP